MIKTVLFVCDANRLRSPTAEEVFGVDRGLDVRSAGVAREASTQVSSELLEWADIVFVMERRQRNIIQKRYPEIYRRKRIVCLYIPDQFERMDPELIELLEQRVAPYLTAIDG